MKTTAEKELRGMAGALCNAHDRGNEIRSRIKLFDQDAAAKLAALDAEINDLDRRADGCDESAVQQVGVKREMRSRTAVKLASDRVRVVAELNDEAQTCFAGVTGTAEFFKIAHERILETTVGTLETLYESRARAEQMAGQTDCIRALWNWRTYLVNNSPDDAIVSRLRSFVDGTKPLWRI